MGQNKIFDLYQILNIDQSLILSENNNANYYLSYSDMAKDDSIAVTNISKAIEIIEKFHSYFHFEQSFCYLLLAYAYYCKKDSSESAAYLEKSIFQDHYNIQALDFKNNNHSTLENILLYDKHHKSETDFLNFAIGSHNSFAAIIDMDKAISSLYAYKAQEARKLLLNLFYDSHRFYIAQALLSLFYKEREDALIFLQKSANILEIKHQQYHQYASFIYKKRASIFVKLGLTELSANDLIKAKNLFPE